MDYSRFTTPTHSRMVKISEKLSGMNLKYDQDRMLRLDGVEKRLTDIDDKYVEFQELVQNRNNQLRQQLQKLQRSIR